MECKCCDKYWCEPHKRIEGLTNGDYFLLINIHAGGFNMVYVKDTETANACKKRRIEKLLKLGYIYAGNVIYGVTGKGFNLILSERKG
jgi:hypothetical protein